MGSGFLQFQKKTLQSSDFEYPEVYWSDEKLNVGLLVLLFATESNML